MAGGPNFYPGRPAIVGLGQVEYKLARDAVVREYRKGRLSRSEICDAQPELMRVARSIGKVTEIPCPICDVAMLVQVQFAFGSHLPAGGRAIGSVRELAELARDKPEVAFYVVEVCTECSWNHLLRMFTAESARRRSQASKR